MNARSIAAKMLGVEDQAWAHGEITISDLAWAFEKVFDAACEAQREEMESFYNYVNLIPKPEFNIESL